jgi:hypothetical protein
MATLMEALSILLVSAEIFVIVSFLGKGILNLLRGRKKDLDFSEKMGQKGVPQRS